MFLAKSRSLDILIGPNCLRQHRFPYIKNLPLKSSDYKYFIDNYIRKPFLHFKMTIFSEIKRYKCILKEGLIYIK